MKKLFVALTAIAFVMAMGIPVLADVEIEGTITKSKDKMVCETVSIDKAVYVGVKQVVKPSNSAEAQAVKNDVNQANEITENPYGGTDAVSPDYEENPITGEYFQVPGTGSLGTDPTMVTKKAVIDSGSLDGASGIINVNQSPGSINNQGNAASIAYSGAAAAVSAVPYLDEGETRFVGGAFLHAESSAEKINGDCLVVIDDATGELVVVPAGNIVTAHGTERTNEINSALGSVTGIVGVNQSAGNINNQNNAASLSVGSAIAALSEADLGMVNVGNMSTENATATIDILCADALASASGIIGVNQSSGNMNNQANVVAACVILNHPGTF
ncbi:MAG: hypothetical protein JRD93_06395 [Deltaproteobacteria bacterium]|nr:hypothetical protein [Deltaproteobacteria bacterium]MBW2661606.1 hypothetical protein [Deltaproteobacteria bacterium]